MIMLVALTSAFLTWERAAPAFRSSATLSVLPPRVNVEGVPRNPYLDIASASNADIAQRLSIQVNGTEWRSRLTDQGFSPDYLIDHGDATSPILRITIETPNPELSEATLTAVVGAVEEELAEQQERFDINQRSRFTIDTLDRSPGSVRVFGNRTRLTGAILVLGGIAAVIAAQALDNFQRRRRGERPTPNMRSADSGGRQGFPNGQNGFNGGNSQDRSGLWVPRPNVEGRPQPVGAAAPAQSAVPDATAPPALRGPILGHPGQNQPKPNAAPDQRGPKPSRPTGPRPNQGVEAKPRTDTKAPGGNGDFGPTGRRPQKPGNRE
jgi:hypothetical protein